jgi:hypothetical protein
MIEKVKKKYAIFIIWVSITDFPEPSLVLASMLYHFEPDNDFAITGLEPGDLRLLFELIIMSNLMNTFSSEITQGIISIEIKIILLINNDLQW